ncbi:MAG: TadE/TadG family type IV pilus assembly protein [Candidatus Binatia bacterium]|jgi:Flp pilus assembly protein TadG
MFDCTMISRWTFSRPRTFARDTSGIAAVEFGLIAPVLLIMLVGVVEITRAVSIDRRFGQVTALVADLISREEVLKREDLDGVNASGKRTGIYGIVEHVMGVWGVSTLKLHVYPVRASSDDRNDIYVYADTTNRPSFGSAAGSPKNVCDPYTGLTTDLLETRGTAIIVEGEYGYTPLIAQGILTPSTWQDRAVLAPRSGCVSFEAETTLPQPDCEPTPSCE